MPLSFWRREPGARERLPSWFRALLIVFVEIVVVVALLVVVGSVVIPLVAPPVVIATPTPITSTP